MIETIFTQTVETPCGWLILQSTGKALICCDWAEGWHRETVNRRLERYFPRKRVEQKADDIITRTEEELREYFAGSRRSFDIPLDLAGTDFQRAVWDELLRIDFGKLVTYCDIAAVIGRPKAVHAVGVAVGENPCSILVPCHRVVGSNRSLTGYGGGYDAKRRLLEIEGFVFAEHATSNAALKACSCRQMGLRFNS